MHNRNMTFIAVVAVMLTVGTVWLANRPAAVRNATWNDVLAEAEAGGYKIITTDELSERYGKDGAGLLLVDTRQEWEFRTGHIKGAMNFPMEPSGWSRWRKASSLETALGPDKDRTIIFY